MKKHYERYDLDTVCSVCGMNKEAPDGYTTSTHPPAPPTRRARFSPYAPDQHSTGVGNTRPCRSSSSCWATSASPAASLPRSAASPTYEGCYICASPGATSYLKWPVEGRTPSIAAYCEEQETAVDGYWSNTPKFLVSYLKSFFGDAATAENDYGYNWLPKVDNAAKRSLQNTWHLMEQGVVKGYMFFGQNPMQSQANASYYRRVAENLDWLVFDDMYYTETAEFWKSPKTKGPRIGNQGPNATSCPSRACSKSSARSSTPAASCSGATSAPRRAAIPRPLRSAHAHP